MILPPHVTTHDIGACVDETHRRAGFRIRAPWYVNVIAVVDVKCVGNYRAPRLIRLNSCDKLVYSSCFIISHTALQNSGNEFLHPKGKKGKWFVFFFGFARFPYAWGNFFRSRFFFAPFSGKNLPKIPRRWWWILMILISSVTMLWAVAIEARFAFYNEL